jgi:hypothetical protein
MLLMVNVTFGSASLTLEQLALMRSTLLMGSI